MRLPDPRDVVAWDQFVSIYQPLIYRLAISKGFQEADAQDLVQEVMIAVSKAIQRWEPDPKRGRFRDWLFRIAQNMMINFLTRRKYRSLASSLSAADWIESLPDESNLDEQSAKEFELEYRRELFWMAADSVRGQVHERTWRAFWLTSMENYSAEKAALELNMKKGAVVVARCRVVARLRNAVSQLEQTNE